MIEPIIHSSINPYLPDGHWLLAAVPEVEWGCHHCQYIIYRQPQPDDANDVVTGTVMTWVESGLVLGGDSDEDPTRPFLLCIYCFRAQSTVTPTLYRFWMLNDDGTPQEPRLTSWITENLTVVETGIDIFNDPPMELAGYERLP